MRILYLPNSYCQQRQFEKPNFLAYPVRLAMEATYYAKQGHEVDWGNAQGRYDKIITEPEGLPFLSLPKADRILTQAHNKIYQENGNFKFLPATYIQSASGCWWGKCSFCVENNISYEVREVEDVISEIEECQALGFKEVFDDSATFPTGGWLDRFCRALHRLGFERNRSFPVFSCNMRLVDIDYFMLANSGFRMVLFGLESANQKTLDRINKGRKVEDVRYVIKAAEAGLEPHIAVMFGYSWETDKDAIRTLQLVHYLLRKGYAKTAQASLYRPPDGIRNETHKKYVKKIYSVFKYPDFWFRQIRDCKSVDDLKYLWRKIKAGLNDYN